ncbi:MAG: hypothetical protein KAW90_06990 [Dehalococcoidales bacterium]|nr:hypothetical protein [Dehalococcoidales bacterium]
MPAKALAQAAYISRLTGMLQAIAQCADKHHPESWRRLESSGFQSDRRHRP